MITHFVVDDKFVDDGIKNFENTLPDKNIVIHVGNVNKTIQHIKYAKIKRIKNSELFSLKFYKSLKRSKAIVFHCLNGKFITIIKLLRFLNFDGKLIWIGWGADYYSLLADHSLELYEPETKKYIDKNIINKYLSNKIKSIKNFLIDKDRVINKIDFFSPPIYEDYQLVKNLNPSFKPKYIKWNYGTSARNVFNREGLDYCTNNNILIGNSGALTNNHFDVFEILNKLNQVKDRKLIVPLSYGVSLRHRDMIIEQGKKLFGDNFYPLLKFMSIDDYFKHIGQCSHVIMNHRRQQGLANISASIYRGASVFLNEESSLYKFYKNRGFIIFKVSDIRRNPELLDIPLDKYKVEKNRKILKKEIGLDEIKKHTQRLINVINS